MLTALYVLVIALDLLFRETWAIAVPPNAPSGAAAVDPSVLSVSIEFFTLPGYTQIEATSNCLENLAQLRGGARPAIRIGGTTQDRATYDPELQSAVNYTVASPADAPDSLTYGPSFFTLAAQLQSDAVTLGLNRQLNNQAASLAAAVQAKNTMDNLFALELGNEPEFYASNSPIIPKGRSWNQDTDAMSEKAWFTAFSPSVGNIFQGAVYLSWSAGGLLSRIGSDGARLLKSISRHSYPQSACGGASTNLPSLMSHSEIVSYTEQYKAEAAATHAAGLRYFLGETNSGTSGLFGHACAPHCALPVTIAVVRLGDSGPNIFDSRGSLSFLATCGGGGISPTFGAALWIVDYVLQAVLNGVDRLYFHQGTIGDCAYCFWGTSSVFAPYYGAAFVSDFLGTDGAGVAMLDNGTSPLAAYAVYSSNSSLLRLLLINSNYYDGTASATRSSSTFTLTGLQARSAAGKRLTAPSATALSNVTISGSAFSTTCTHTGSAVLEDVQIAPNGTLSVSLPASEALIVVL